MVWRRVGIEDDKQNKAKISPDGALSVELSGDSVNLEFPESIDVNVTNSELPVQVDVEFPANQNVTVTNTTLPVNVEFPSELNVNVLNHPDAEFPTNQSVTVSNESLDVNVLNQPELSFPTSIDVNVTNDVRVTGTGTPLPVSISGEFELGSTMSSYPTNPPKYVDTYAASVYDVPGQPSTVLAVLALYVPMEATRRAVVTGWYMSVYSAGGAMPRRSMVIARGVGVSGGTQIGANNLQPFSGGSTVPVTEVRHNNPNVTYVSQGMFSCRPGSSTALETGESEMSWSANDRTPGITLLPGQGLVMRVNASSTVAHWNAQMTWSEFEL